MSSTTTTTAETTAPAKQANTYLFGPPPPTPPDSKSSAESKKTEQIPTWQPFHEIVLPDALTFAQYILKAITTDNRDLSKLTYTAAHDHHFVKIPGIVEDELPRVEQDEEEQVLTRHLLTMETMGYFVQVGKL